MKILAPLSGVGLAIWAGCGLIQPETFAQAPPATPMKVTSVEGITEYRLANGMDVLLFLITPNPP